MTSSSGHYRVQQTKGAGRNEIREKWRALEAAASPHFFLTWSWIDTWLDTFAPDVVLYEIFSAEERVAICLVVHARQSRHGWLRSRTLRLQETGDPASDQVCTEYNGLLCLPGHETGATASLMAALYADAGWDELIIGKTLASEAERFYLDKLHTHRLSGAPCYGVDLATVRASGKSYLESLSSNTRYQIRKSLKLYRQRGQVQLEVAQSEHQALSFLEETAGLHIARWGTDSTSGSGFVNPRFVRFHENLVKAAFPMGQVELIRVTVAGGPVAYLYNFICNNRVYFYLSGLSYECDSKIKPGNVAHALAIQQYLERGFEYYDFMAGEARYKRSLGRQAEDMIVVSLQRPRPSLLLERLLRKIKHRLLPGDGGKE